MCGLVSDVKTIHCKLKHLEIFSEICVKHGKLNFAISRASLKFQEIFFKMLLIAVNKAEKVSTSCTRSHIATTIKKHEPNQRTSGPVNAHLMSWPSKAQNIQNLENI